MKKFLGVMCLAAVLSMSSTFAAEVVTESWATDYFYEECAEVADPGYEERLNPEHSLGEYDATGKDKLEGHFTGIGYFGETGIEYYFDKEVGGTKYKGTVVHNPDSEQPDLTLHEITWDGDNSTWIAEGVKVYAINYNGTGEDKLLAYAYNKLAEKRATAYDDELKQVDGAKIEYSYPEGNKNVYATDIYFPDEFEFCDGFKLVDITEDLKVYGGNGQKTHDGYDLDALHAYVVSYDVEYSDETAVAMTQNSEFDVKIGKSWQGVVICSDVERLREEDICFDIIAGQYYKVGSGKIYLNKEGIVAVEYSFDKAIFPIEGEETVKLGIYSDINDMMKKGKLLGNGKLTKQEEISEGDFCVRLHFDASIPSCLYSELDIR